MNLGKSVLGPVFYSLMSSVRKDSVENSATIDDEDTVYLTVWHPVSNSGWFPVRNISSKIIHLK